MNAKRIGWWLGLVIAVGLTWQLSRTNAPTTEPFPAVPPEPQSKEAARPTIEPAEPPLPPPLNPVAAKLNAANLTAKDDVRNVHLLLEQLFGVWKGQRRPMSLNAEFTQALTGDNPARLPFVPAAHPAIVNGELTDRWGQPYQFHQLSMDRIEVRSAGPDMRLYTEDDALYSPWTKKPPKAP